MKSGPHSKQLKWFEALERGGARLKPPHRGISTLDVSHMYMIFV